MSDAGSICIERCRLHSSLNHGNPVVGEPFVEAHPTRFDVEAGGEFVDEPSPNRLGCLSRPESPMQLLATLAVRSRWQIHDHIPEDGLATVLADVRALVDVSLHQRFTSARPSMG